MFNHNTGSYFDPKCVYVSLAAEGYFYTYDLAKCDTEGNYQITGRAVRIKGDWLEVPKLESVMVSI